VRPYLSLLLTPLLLGGCNLLKGDSDEAVIGNLKYQPMVIEKQPISGVNRAEVMRNYRELRRLKPDPRLNSEATRRLADLELDNSEEQLLEQPQASPPVNRKMTQGSIQLYESLLRGDPNYPHRDQVLYQLSRAYELAGEPEKMMAALRELVSRYPDSPSWAEAQFRRGERFFVLHRFAAAEAAYGAILKRRQDSPFYDRALFKQGWARFKQRHIEAGLDTFTQLLDRKLRELPEMDSQRLSPADRELLKETLRVISLTFSELGGTRRITRYFDRHGHRPYEFMVYRALGDLYQKQERIRDAAEAYLAFVELYPTHPQAPRLSVQVIDLYNQQEFQALALQNKQAFTERYRVHGEHWKQFAPADRQWLNDKLRGYLKELAEYYHALAQQVRGKDRKALAEKARRGDQAVIWYQRYLESFPDEQASGGVSFQLAELLLELHRYPEAIEYYERSAYLYPLHPKSSEAGYAAILAYEAGAKGLKGAVRERWQLAAIESALRFAKTFPKDPRALAVLTQAAERLYAAHDLTRARQAARQVLAWQPPAPPPLRRTAWIVAAHAAFDQQAYAEAETGYQAALALLPKRDQQYRALQERLAAAVYEQGVALRKAGKQRQAAHEFLRVGTLVPGASIRATAEFDAASSLIAAKEWPGAVRILEAFRKRYPKSKLLPEINNKLAVAYLETQQPVKAAAEFAAIARQAGKPELRREAGWQAAQLYEKAGRNGQAIQAYRAYIRAFPSPLTQVVEAQQRLADLSDKLGKRGDRAYWLRQIVKQDAGAGKARTDRTRYLAAKASLELARPAYDGFARIQLKAPLKQNLKRKKRQMKRAIAAYKRAAEYGVAEVTTAATYRIGELYRQFGKALLKSERPKGLNPEELEQYEILLEEQAYPFEDKAIALFETNTQRTAQGVYDTWVQKSFAALAKLLPARYAKREKSEEVVDALN